MPERVQYELTLSGQRQQLVPAIIKYIKNLITVFFTTAFGNLTVQKMKTLAVLRRRSVFERLRVFFRRLQLQLL